MHRLQSMHRSQPFQKSYQNRQLKQPSLRDIPRLGISRCLLGEKVRYDGGHKRDRFLTDTLGYFVEWIPICPEVDAGLGTPREAMRLEGTPEKPKLVTIQTHIDQTDAITRFSTRKIRELHQLKLDGYVFKKDSPSCGMKHIRVYKHGSPPSRRGSGLFAQAFHESFPLIPIEDEGRLNDPGIRENFIDRVFAYHRWQSLFCHRATRGALVDFHTRHKYLLMAHSRRHYQDLGHLLASANQYTPKELAHRYASIFMEAVKIKTTVRKHVNVLQHLVGHFKKRVSQVQRMELQEVISNYHQGLTSLKGPLALITHYVREFNIDYLANQVYLQPHPSQHILKNYT